jgi:ribonuclease P protein subunit POP4
MEEKKNSVYFSLDEKLSGKIASSSAQEMEDNLRDVVKLFVKDTHCTENLVEKSIKTKGIRLDTYTNPKEVEKNHERKIENKKKKILSRSQLKRQGLLDIKKDNLRYEVEGKSLHHLWLQYIHSILPKGILLNKCQVLAVADLHGALLAVFQSRNPQFVNVTGFVVQETENTFVLLQEKNSVITVPKSNCIFYLPLDGTIFVIHGQNFCHRTSHRSKMKLKPKHNLLLH